MILLSSIQRFVQIFMMVIWNMWKFYHNRKVFRGINFSLKLCVPFLPVLHRNLFELEGASNPFLSNVSFWSPWKYQKNFGFLIFSGRSKGNIGKKRVKLLHTVRLCVLTQFSWHNMFNKAQEYTGYLKDVSGKELNLHYHELAQMRKLNVGRSGKQSLT